MFALNPLPRHARFWGFLRIYGAWVGCVLLCLAGGWVWRSTLMTRFIDGGLPPRALPLVDFAVSTVLGMLFLVLVIVLEGRCRAWEEERVLGPRLARVLGIGSLAIGLGLALLAR